MTLSATSRMILAAEAMTGTVQRNLGKRAACERAAREKAAATAQAHAVICGASLPLSAADGALEAIIDTYTRLRGKEFAATRILAAVGRRR